MTARSDSSKDTPNIVLAMTGASGAVYALRLLEVLVSAGARVHLSISSSARLVIQQELGCELELNRLKPTTLPIFAGSPLRGQLPSAMAEVLGELDPRADGLGEIVYHHYENLMAPIASGSFLTSGMVICPCSGSTLGAVVHGTGENLIHRAAGVHLKERRKLVLVPRETPLSTIHLENMHRAALAGAVVLPAMPGYYHGASTIRDLVDFVVARICDQLEIPHTLMKRWGT
jgi:4-hydroxy-3-polyprenylbenzoate decarboxylase